MGEINKKNVEQIDVFTYLDVKSKTLSSRDLAKAIAELSRAHEIALKREAKEKRERIEREIQTKQNREKDALDKTIQSATTMELPIDYENAFGKDENVNNVHAESIADGLILSLNNLGRVDIEYISLITGETHKKVIETLKGSIYQNPEKWDECFYKGWETADEYLTGNLVKKFTAAKKVCGQCQSDK